MFTEHVSSVYYKHHIKHRTFFLMMQFFIDVRKNVKHRANDASNNGTMDIAHPYSTPTSHLKSLSKSKFSK